MRKILVWGAAACLALALGVAAAPAAGLAGTMKAKKCLKCHTDWKGLDNVVIGEFQSRSNKAKSISVMVEPGTNLIVKFTPKTTVENVPNIKKLKKPIPVYVAYHKKGQDLVANEIIAKPMIKVPPAQLIDAKGLAALRSQKKDFMLVDSRPPIRYSEGHIPGAVSVPFPKMPDMMAKFPKDKDKLIVFYCGGFR